MINASPKKKEISSYDDYIIEDNENFIVINKPTGIPMAVIELVDRNPEAKKVDKPKKTDTKNKKKETLAEPKVASK